MLGLVGDSVPYSGKSAAYLAQVVSPYFNDDEYTLDASQLRRHYAVLRVCTLALATCMELMDPDSTNDGYWQELVFRAPDQLLAIFPVAFKHTSEQKFEKVRIAY